MVQSFNLNDVKGCVVKIFDKMDTIIDSDEILQHVIRMNDKDEVLKISFLQKSGNKDTAITSDVIIGISIRFYHSQVYF